MSKSPLKYCWGCGATVHYEKWGCPICGCRDDADGQKITVLTIEPKPEPKPEPSN